MRRFSLLLFCFFWAAFALFSQQNDMHLTTYTVQKIKSGIELKWEIAADADLQPFDVQRSSDGILYENIASIPRDSILSYRFADETLQGFYPVLYYRLSQSRLDLYALLSPVRELRNVDMSVIIPSLYPSPVLNDAFLHYSPPRGGWLNLTIYDDIGREMIYLNGLKNPHTDIRIDVSSLPTGVYQVIVITEVEIHRLKFIKQ